MQFYAPQLGYTYCGSGTLYFDSLTHRSPLPDVVIPNDWYAWIVPMCTSVHGSEVAPFLIPPRCLKYV